MLLVNLQILDNILLLPQLGVEELGVGLELVGQPLVLLGDEGLLVLDSLLESLIDLDLDVVPVVLALVVAVVVETLLDVTVELLFLGFESTGDLIVGPLLLSMSSLNLLNVLSDLSELLDLRGKLLLSVLDLGFDLLDSLGNLL